MLHDIYIGEGKKMSYVHRCNHSKKGENVHNYNPRFSNWSRGNTLLVIIFTLYFGL